MDDLVPQRELAAKDSVRVTLIDYLVLQIVYEWNGLARKDRLSAPEGKVRARSLSRYDREEAGAQLRALIVLIAGELARDGFPIELGLRFQNPDLPGLDIVTSTAIDDALGSMIDAQCLAGPDRGAPSYLLTEHGDFIRQRADSQLSEYEDLFASKMPDVYFATNDLVKYYRRKAPRVLLRGKVSELVEKYYARPSIDLRFALIELGIRLIVDDIAPRGYYFHKKFRELTRPYRAEQFRMLRGAT